MDVLSAHLSDNYREAGAYDDEGDEPPEIAPFEREAIRLLKHDPQNRRVLRAAQAFRPA
jgi:hypothetical protein